MPDAESWPEKKGVMERVPESVESTRLAQPKPTESLLLLLQRPMDEGGLCYILDAFGGGIMPVLPDDFGQHVEVDTAFLHQQL